jgi:hypothetical protein
MRCSAWSSLAISVCNAVAVALVVAGPAGAHIDAVPAFLVADATETISLTAHNDRSVAMDAFAVTASTGLRVGEVGELEGWSGSTDGKSASWTGGRLAAEDAETFTVVLEAPTAPGPVSLQVEQRYPDGRAVNWSVPLTVVPADESSSTRYVWIALLAAGLVLAALAGLAWRRRSARRLTSAG